MLPRAGRNLSKLTRNGVRWGIYFCCTRFFQYVPEKVLHMYIIYMNMIFMTGHKTKTVIKQSSSGQREPDFPDREMIHPQRQFVFYDRSYDRS